MEGVLALARGQAREAAPVMRLEKVGAHTFQGVVHLVRSLNLSELADGSGDRGSTEVLDLP